MKLNCLYLLAIITCFMSAHPMEKTKTETKSGFLQNLSLTQTMYALITQINQKPALLQDQTKQNALLLCPTSILRCFMQEHTAFIPIFAQKAPDAKFLSALSNSALFNHESMQERFFSLSIDKIISFACSNKNVAIATLIAEKAPENIFKDICLKANNGLLSNEIFSTRLDTLILNDSDFAVQMARRSICHRTYELISKYISLSLALVRSPMQTSIMVTQRSISSVSGFATAPQPFPHFIPLGNGFDPLIHDASLRNLSLDIDPLSAENMKIIGNKISEIYCTVKARLFPKVTITEGQAQNLTLQERLLLKESLIRGFGVQWQVILNPVSDQLEISLQNQINYSALGINITADPVAASSDAHRDSSENKKYSITIAAHKDAPVETVERVINLRNTVKENGPTHQFDYREDKKIQSSFDKIPTVFKSANNGINTLISQSGKLTLTVKGSTAPVTPIGLETLNKFATQLCIHIGNETVFCDRNKFAPHGEAIHVIFCNNIYGMYPGAYNVYDLRNQYFVENEIKTKRFEELPQALQNKMLNNAISQKLQSEQLASDSDRCTTLMVNKKISVQEKLELVTLFTLYHQSSLRSRFQATVNTTGDYARLTKAVSQIKLQEISDFLKDVNNHKKALAYALWVQEFSTFVGPQLSRNSNAFSQLMVLAEQQAQQYTGKNFIDIDGLARQYPVINRNLIAHVHDNEKTLIQHKQLVHLLARIDHKNTQGIENLIHLALLMNKLGNTQNVDAILSTLSNIHNACLGPSNIPKPTDIIIGGGTNNEPTRIPGIIIAPGQYPDPKGGSDIPSINIPDLPSTCPPEKEKPEGWKCDWHERSKLPSFDGIGKIIPGANGPEIDPNQDAKIPQAEKPDKVAEIPQAEKPVTNEEPKGIVEVKPEEEKKPLDGLTLDSKKNGVLCTEEDAKAFEDMLILLGPDGQIMKPDGKHIVGGTLEGGEFSGFHVGDLEKLVAEGSIILDDTVDFSKIYDVPEGWKYVRLKLAGKEFEAQEFKDSSIFPKMSKPELVTLIQEAWEDAMLKKDLIKKMTKNPNQPLPYIRGKTKNGVEIEFNSVNFKKGTIGSIFARFGIKAVKL